jgi:Protein of unknown function DUF262/HNH endonuclease
MPNKVNLDALIVREDFKILSTPIQYSTVQTIQIRDLEPGSFFYQVLRKPDFQRETADWSSEWIHEFVQSFLNGDLIPGIILWNSGSNIFVIDGAHRLSALMAWVQNDYGDGPVSRPFFDQRIPPEQLASADETRRLINKNIQDYAAHKYVIQHPDNAEAELLDRARRLAALAIQVQWVIGNADKAEDSFYKINQKAVVIDPTELRLIKAREKPNALAARAIVHAGTGHKYWSAFDISTQEQIQNIAKEINDILFTPSLQTPIKTLDLPIAGRGYSPQTLQLVFDLVNTINNVKSDSVLSIDQNGSETLKFLKSTRKTIYRISGNHPSSLGLHPAIYFYSANGRYQPTAFLAIVELIKDFEERNFYKTFTDHRQQFEDFILRYKDFANQVATVRGSGTKGMKILQEIYQATLNSLIQGKNENEILETLLHDKRFPFLKLDETKVNDFRKDFDTNIKSATFLRDAIKSAAKCNICHSLIHVNSISIDHIERKRDGGLGTLDNAQLTHPYCNSTYKN